MRPDQLLAALADLAPSGGERVLDVGRGGGFLWIGSADRISRRPTADRLAGIDALHSDERVLRRGFGFVLGVTEVGGRRATVRLPLVVQPVRLERRLSGYRVVPAGDLELTSLVEDGAVAARLEAAIGVDLAAWVRRPDIGDWIGAAAEAAGLPVTKVVGKAPRPAFTEGLVGVAASALFVAREVNRAGIRESLLAWSRRPGLEGTALAAVYGTDGTRSPLPPDDPRLLSPLPLNAAQRSIVARARHEPVVVVSGPPGNGKSHTLVATALDVVDRGGSVLIAAQSAAAVDALATLLSRYQAPTPVLFGDAEHRDALLAALEQGGAPVAGEPEGESVLAASRRVARLRAALAAELERERLAATLPTWEPLLVGLRADVPAAFEPGLDLGRARSRLAASDPGAPGWDRWRRRWRRWLLRTRLRVGPQVPDDRLAAALEAAAALDAAARLAAGGGTDLAATWKSYVDALADLSRAVGTAMRRRATSGSRWGAGGRRSAMALAGALRAGRHRRREILAGLDGHALVRALPLWIGTVTDVEDLLPPEPGLFDLVILDEAVQVDQIRAAPVLARARRAVVAGDPRQLRFVSFVADVDVALTLDRHGLGAFVDRLDVRRSSAFDVAAGAAPVTLLSEHFRSAPHLIEFSARRFYRERLELMTRHPRNETEDRIDVVRVAGAVDEGINRVEIDTVVEVVRTLAGSGGTDIGVVTPFRAQADALDRALLDAFSLEEIERLRLRSATVHGFQGSEASTIIASLALADTDASSRLRFITDPHLFNVLVTRARERMVVVTSLTSPNGLVGDYLAHAEKPLATQRSGPERGEADDWVEQLGVELGRAGVPVRPAYPVGSWHLDLCAGEGSGAAGLICRVHPEGIDAHLDRQVALVGAGWRLIDAFASRWSGNAARAAIEIAGLLRPSAP